MRKFFSIMVLLSVMCLASRAAEVGGILKATYEKPGVAESFKAGGDWYPYPAYEDRDAWKKMFTKQGRKEAIKKGEKYLGYKWKHIPASTFIALTTSGDKQALRKIEIKNREAFCRLMIAELAEGKGRFLSDIADGIWFYGTSYHWSLSNQTYNKQLPRYEMEKIALGNVKIAVTVVIGWHFFKNAIDKIDPMICSTFEATAKRIIIDPAMDGYGTDKFVWMGPTNSKRNNWNPWCNHGALLTVLLMEKDQERLNAAIKASVENVDEYLKWYTADAACEEGAGYWGQSVGRFCEYLQMLYDASNGKFDVMPNDFICSMADYRSRAFVGVNAKTGRDIQMNFADGNSSHAAKGSVVYWKVGKLFRNEEMKNLSLYTFADVQKKKFSYPSFDDEEGFRLLETIRISKELSSEIDKLNQKLKDGVDFDKLRNSLRASVPHVTWYPVTQQALLRTGDRWFLGAKAGSNGEVHGHNDVGSFMFFVDNLRFLVDPGVETYTAKTFSKDRFTIWTMVSEWHNCPAPNGVNQKNGNEFKASSCTIDQEKRNYVMTSEFSGAYPAEAHCTSYVRKITLKDSDSSSKLTIEDSYALTERNAADDVHFITSGQVKKVRNGVVHITIDDRTMQIVYPSTMKFSIESKDLTKSSLQRQWGDEIHRLVFKSSPNAPLKGSYKFVISMVNSL